MEAKIRTVLLAEDDEGIAEPLVFGLQAEGFNVVHVTDGASALELAKTENVEIVLLDVMMPVMDGFTVCRELRNQSSIPIIMLTAKGEEMDRVMGLELGADDYIVKPFSFRELLARINAVLRRKELDAGDNPHSVHRLQTNDLVLDLKAHTLLRAGKPVVLRQREFDLLASLMKNAGAAMSHQQLLDEVWGDNWVGDPHTLQVHIRWLREKVEEDPSNPNVISTVRGFGYRFVESNSPPSNPQ